MAGSSLEHVKVRGPFRGPSGYDHHVRRFVRELHRQGVEVELSELPGWGPGILPPTHRDPWFESLDRPLAARVFLHFCMPHQVTPEVGLINVNFTMFEADRVPAAWIRCGFAHDRVVLPTPSSAEAWLRSGFPEERIRLCPLGIDPDLFSGTARPLSLVLDDGSRVADYRTRFLNVSELTPRKNVFGLVRTWLRATVRGDDAVLVVKLGCYAPGLRERFIVQLSLLEKDVGRRFRDAAPVHFVYDLFPDAEMPRFYASATHYISLSLGEGWDQPMVEAGASGLALIAPAHSAYTSYLDGTVAHLVPAQQVPADYPGDRRTAALFQGAHWWNPDQDAAAVLVRSCIDGVNSKPSPRGRILRDLTWEKATRRLIAILAEAAGSPRAQGSP